MVLDEQTKLSALNKWKLLPFPELVRERHDIDGLWGGPFKVTSGLGWGFKGWAHGKTCAFLQLSSVSAKTQCQEQKWRWGSAYLRNHRGVWLPPPWTCELCTVSFFCFLHIHSRCCRAAVMSAERQWTERLAVLIDLVICTHFSG